MEEKYKEIKSNILNADAEYKENIIKANKSLDDLIKTYMIKKAKAIQDILKKMPKEEFECFIVRAVYDEDVEPQLYMLMLTIYNYKGNRDIVDIIKDL